MCEPHMVVCPESSTLRKTILPSLREAVDFARCSSSVVEGQWRIRIRNSFSYAGYFENGKYHSAVIGEGTMEAR